MKTYRYLLLFTAAVSPAALFLTGCSKTDNSSSTMDKVQADAKAVTSDVKTAAVDSWDAIKDFTYERRSDFSTGIDRMAKQLDDRTRELKDKMAGAPDSGSKDRATAIKDYDEARADLNSKLSDLAKATTDTWADAKDKVVQAWDRVKAAFEKVKASAGS
jgi:PBP1b-binding outer membrane lipoprotein LpoB